MGEVLHKRLRPAQHGFRYGVYFLMLPMRVQGSSDSWVSRWYLARNRFGMLSFYDSDHGDDHKAGLDWLQSLLTQQGISDANGDIWLQCFPRVLGYVFKPVSFWFCHRNDGSLRCIVAEVNNTFGERHAYLLDTGSTIRWGETLSAKKVFHVSPFCSLAGEYRFRFARTEQGDVQRIVSRIDYAAPRDTEAQLEALLMTSISGRLQAVNAKLALWAFVRYPFMSLGVIARIHWQALRLWLKHVPFHRKPDAPEHFVTHALSISSNQSTRP
jgi:DUF1365 family protein